MHIGLLIFPTDTTMQPVALARAAEERGFESLWFPEHSHIPADRTTPWGGREGAPPLPEWYWRAHDQMIALAAAAAATERIRLGTGISLVAQHDPIWLAKQVASLDMISGGRFELGIGYGWNKEEMAHHGVGFTERRAMVREKILAMKELWTKEAAEFHGTFVDFDPSWSWPKPVQQPHPPILMGSSPGPKTFAAIAEYCDGWMPIVGQSPIDEKLAQLRSAAVEAGRDPSEIRLHIFQAKAERLDDYRELGAYRAILPLPQGPEAEVVAALDEYTTLL